MSTSFGISEQVHNAQKQELHGYDIEPQSRPQKKKKKKEIIGALVSLKSLTHIKI